MTSNYNMHVNWHACCYNCAAPLDIYIVFSSIEHVLYFTIFFNTLQISLEHNRLLYKYSLYHKKIPLCHHCWYSISFNTFNFVRTREIGLKLQKSPIHKPLSKNGLYDICSRIHRVLRRDDVNWESLYEQSSLKMINCLDLYVRNTNYQCVYIDSFFEEYLSNSESESESDSE